MSHISAVYTCSSKAIHELGKNEEGQIDLVNTDLSHTNAKSLGIVAKFKTSSLYSNVSVSNKIDTGNNSNISPFHIFKILFPKSTNKTERQLRMCKLKLLHKKRKKL